jgi:hypothetical protein
MLDAQVFGLRSGAHHLTNAALHALAAMLLFAFLKRATGARWASAFAAGVFALHPLHVESVAWVAERKDVLCAVFWFLALWAYVQWTRGGARQLVWAGAGGILLRVDGEADDRHPPGAAAAPGCLAPPAAAAAPGAPQGEDPVLCGLDGRCGRHLTRRNGVAARCSRWRRFPWGCEWKTRWSPAFFIWRRLSGHGAGRVLSVSPRGADLAGGRCGAGSGGRFHLDGAANSEGGHTWRWDGAGTWSRCFR